MVAMWALCLIGLLETELWAAGLAAVVRAAAGIAPFGWHIDPDTVAVVVEKIGNRLLMLLTGVIPVFLLEMWLVGYAASSLRRLTAGRTASGNYDLATFLIVFCGLWRFWTIVGTLGAGYFAGLLGNHLVAWIVGQRLQLDTGSMAVNLALYFVVFTFVDYWSHRIFHFTPFWYLHRLHHSATEMTVLSAFRNHPGVALVEPFTKLWPLAFFAAPPGYLLFFVYLLTAYEFLIHSNVTWTWGWFGRWVIVPPLGHRMHHSSDAKHRDKMLSILVLWDRMFGTWLDLDGTDVKLGVTDASYNSGNFLREFWRDLAAFGRGMVALLPGRMG